MLSDGTVCQLKERGLEIDVPYEERMEYMKLVRNARMNECKDQVCNFPSCWGGKMALFEEIDMSPRAVG